MLTGINNIDRVVRFPVTAVLSTFDTAMTVYVRNIPYFRGMTACLDEKITTSLHPTRACSVHRWGLGRVAGAPPSCCFGHPRNCANLNLHLRNAYC